MTAIQRKAVFQWSRICNMSTKRTDEIDADLPDDFEGDAGALRRFKAQRARRAVLDRRSEGPPAKPAANRKVQMPLKQWAKESAQEMADGLNKRR